MSGVLLTQATTGLNAGVLPLTFRPISAGTYPIGGVGSFEPATTTKLPIGFAPLPLGIFGTFLSLNATWKISRAIVDSMPGNKKAVRFEEMTYDEVVQLVSDAGMSDASLVDSGRKLSARTGQSQTSGRLYFRCLRYFSNDLLKRIVYSRDHFRLESLLIDMVVAGESAAVASLARLFPGEWTTAFLKLAAQTHPAIHREMVRLAEESAPLFWRGVFYLVFLYDCPPRLGYLHPER